MIVLTIIEAVLTLAGLVINGLSLRKAFNAEASNFTDCMKALSAVGLLLCLLFSLIFIPYDLTDFFNWDGSFFAYIYAYFGAALYSTLVTLLLWTVLITGLGRVVSSDFVHISKLLLVVVPLLVLLNLHLLFVYQVDCHVLSRGDPYSGEYNSTAYEYDYGEDASRCFPTPKVDPGVLNVVDLVYVVALRALPCLAIVVIAAKCCAKSAGKGYDELGDSGSGSEDKVFILVSVITVPSFVCSFVDVVLMGYSSIIVVVVTRAIIWMYLVVAAPYLIVG